VIARVLQLLMCSEYLTFNKYLFLLYVVARVLLSGLGCLFRAVAYWLKFELIYFWVLTVCYTLKGESLQPPPIYTYIMF